MSSRGWSGSAVLKVVMLIVLLAIGAWAVRANL